MISSFVSVIEDTKSLSLSEEKERSPQHKALNPPSMVTYYFETLKRLTVGIQLQNWSSIGIVETSPVTEWSDFQMVSYCQMIRLGSIAQISIDVVSTSIRYRWSWAQGSGVLLILNRREVGGTYVDQMSLDPLTARPHSLDSFC